MLACLGDGFCGYRAAAKVTHNPVQTVTGWYLKLLKEKSRELITYKRRFGKNTTEEEALHSINLQAKRIAAFGSERWLSVSDERLIHEVFSIINVLFGSSQIPLR